MPDTHDKPRPALHRRALLGAVAAAPTVAALATQPRAAQAAAPFKTQARIVIVGSGLGGIAVASQLKNRLDGARITIVDAKKEHHYQPGYTLVATGVWPESKLHDKNADFHPAGIEWVQDMVAAFEPQANTVVTRGGQRIAYDVLVVATGLQLDYGQIAGMDVSAIGRNGLGSVYASPQAATATWQAMDAFRKMGGTAVMTLPAGPLKCAGAPLKMTFMVADRLRQAGTLASSKVLFHTGLPTQTVFGVKPVNDLVLARWKDLGVQTNFLSKLVAVDLGAKRATFASPEGERTEVPYDFIHVVPPMRAPDVVKQSPLAWADGPFAAGGWLEVDKSSLQHRRFANVFGIGDINGTPRGKTAATVKKSAPLVAENVVALLAGKPLSSTFDGYTSCPLILREGSALLIEFDYEGRLTPSMPMIDPLQESYLAWLMKMRMLKPAYVSVLKGRV
jgi:sulfide:quinone oxidoreductase